MPKHETFLPRFMLDSSRVVFPAVNTSEAAYRTVLLSNTGTTPILFDFEKDNTESVLFYLLVENATQSSICFENME